MRYRLLGLLTLVAVAGAGDGAGRAIVDFRVASDPRGRLRGWLLEYDDSGFRFERFGAGRRVRVSWDDLVEEDRTRLRRRLKLDLSEDERLGRIPGHRLHFRTGGSAEGLLLRVDAKGRHWLLREGLELPYPEDRIERVEEIKVLETDVYDEDDLYRRRLERTPPATAQQHRDLADRLLDIGNLEDARHHYREAMRMRPDWSPALGREIDGIDALLRDEHLATLLRKVRSRYRLHKDYEGARESLDRFMADHPDRRREATRILDELDARQRADQLRRFTRVKNEELDRVVDDYTRKQTTLQEALAWVGSGLAEDLRRRVAERMGLSADEVHEFLRAERTGAPHWATYWSGSFIFSKRAKRGKSTPREVRGDPDRWWSRYADGARRGSFLRAYAAEHLPELFEVVQVRLEDCSGCGGTGQVRHSSVSPVNALGGQGGNHAGHEWSQLCPRCFGAGRDRSVAYR